MMRIVEMADSAAAKSYYTGSLARADYYADGQEVTGCWFGAAAKRLGLAGQAIDQKTFATLVDNRHPQRPEQSLTERTRSQRRVGYDVNFHGPKGLSVVHALTGDTRIYDAFLGAVRATMKEMEQSMQVRVRIGSDAGTDRTTANWIYGEFVHLTARPTDEGVPDPHLHAHCCVINASYDEVEARWKAAQVGGIKRDAYYYEAAFHARLAQGVRTLGYRIEARGKYWDLAGVPTTVIDKYSKRAGQIEEFAKEHGVTDAKARDRLGARTRAGKRKGLTDAQLKAAWLSELSVEEKAAIQSARQNADGSQIVGHGVDNADVARGCVRFAVAHTFERQSVASEHRLAEAALRHGLSRGIEVAAVWKEMEHLVERGEIHRCQIGNHDDQRHCTTREAYAETSRCIDFAREGMGRCRGLAPNWQIQRPELLLPTAADQRSAIEHVLRAPDRVIAVRGKAGTGKTFATQEVAAALKVAGIQIQALAPTSKAADVLRQEGFASADTVSQLLVNADLQASVAGGVLLIDEAGLLSARQLDQLFRIAREQDCRVLLQYDLGQHRAVERGSPVRDLERYANLQAAEIHMVRRQKPADYKAAVRDLSGGEYEAAFRRFAAMGAIVQVADAQERVNRLADEYLAATRRKDATALIVSPTHREGDAVTRAVRAALRADGRLKAAEHEVTTLRRLGLTEAQRGEARSYEPGQVIQYTQNVSAQPGKHPAIERGDRLIVKERTAEGEVWVERLGAGTGAGDAVFKLALDGSKWFDVYASRPIALSVSDRIRITQNGYVPVLSAKASGSKEDPAQTSPPTGGQRGHGRSKVPKLRLINNAQYQIARFTQQGDPVLNNGWVLPRGYGHLTYGYCTTSHASQGMTTDTVLISQSNESLGAASSEQFYVSCSRGRSAIKIYTDSTQDLLQAVRRSEQQPSAADLVLSTAAGSVSTAGTKHGGIGRRLREQFTKIIDFARSCRNHLRVGLKDSAAQILAEGRQRLAIGPTDTQLAVLTQERSTRRRSLVWQDGEQVCGPYRDSPEPPVQPAYYPPNQIVPSSQPTPTPSKPPSRTVLVPMFDPDSTPNLSL